MKKTISMILTLVLCLSLCACGKSEAAEMVDSMILAIGEVTLSSESAIIAAENAYDQLTDKDKGSVEKLVVLMEARTTYDNLVQEAMKLATEMDQIIHQAREAWATYDITATLALLDSVTAVTTAQEAEITAFYAEIEESCYAGTHFVKLEYLLDITEDNYLVFADNTKYQVSHDETALDDNLTYHLYGFFGSGVNTKLPGMSYVDKLQYVSVESAYPELWSEWAIQYCGEEWCYPSQARVDDLGNILAYFYHTSGSSTAKLEFTILLNN